MEKILKVGVVGCGLMGSGIAEVCARSGYEVTVSEVNAALLKKGLERIESSIGTAVKRGKITEEDKKGSLSRIRGTTGIKDFVNCDIVIEAVIEDLEEKKKVFSALDEACSSSAILASNTSTLSILDLAMMTKKPDKVVGLHFFSPVPIMRLVELVRTIVVSDEAIERMQEFGKSLGKKVVIAKDLPGFIVNRLYTPYILTAVRALELGLASKEDIDQAITLGLNYPMGPFTLLDFVGIDVAYNASMAMYKETNDPVYFPPLLLKKMVIAGRLGRKTGRGFYEYDK